MIMREFIINKYLSLRLEDNQTVIYVNGKQFRQCKFLILSIPIDEVASLEDITSVDEAAQTLDTSLENNDEKLKKLIGPKVEFWAHCSNLQAWYENGYDTRLLHMNLAFSLLHKLTEVGDQLAKSAFKEEIAIRLESGYPAVVNYLFNQGYTSFLSREELFHSILEPEEAETLLDIERITQHKYNWVEDVESLRVATQEQEDSGHFLIQNGKIIGLDLIYENGRFPESIVKLKNLKILYLYILDNTERFPEDITHLRSLEQLNIYFGELSRVKEIPESIGNLFGLKKLSLIDGYFDTIPSSIGNLEKLESLFIHTPNLKVLPKTIGELQSLKFLKIFESSVSSLPFSILKLKSLQKLVIANNLLNKAVIENINSLKFNRSKEYGTFSIYRK